jgi:hypothetical protein
MKFVRLLLSNEPHPLQCPATDKLPNLIYFFYRGIFSFPFCPEPCPFVSSCSRSFWRKFTESHNERERDATETTSTGATPGSAATSLPRRPPPLFHPQPPPPQPQVGASAAPMRPRHRRGRHEHIDALSVARSAAAAPAHRGSGLFPGHRRTRQATMGGLRLVCRSSQQLPFLCIVICTGSEEMSIL